LGGIEKLRKSGASTTNIGDGGGIQDGQAGAVNNAGEGHGVNEDRAEEGDAAESVTLGGGTISEDGGAGIGDDEEGAFSDAKSATPGDTLRKEAEEDVYSGTRRLPLLTNLTVLNENRVCGGAFDDDPEYDMSHITIPNNSAAGVTTQNLHLRKGLYTSRFKSSYSLRERFSIANLRGKSKVEEVDEREDDDDAEIQPPKKNKLGMRPALGKSTFF